MGWGIKFNQVQEDMFSADYWSEPARLYLQHWCQTGNLQVHNSNRDGD